ncbi:hypothetical protein [Kitasatospora sp. NPDC057500]|uniref:hypothetical protein n=1 Tax=Kitasatospora sp. NPDC057500 TaxID=3346151 RepID=UPI0036C4148C
MTIRRPGRHTWYDGEVAAGREWHHAIRTHRTLLMVTGPFTSALGFRSAATGGRRSLLTVPARLTDP